MGNWTSGANSFMGLASGAPDGGVGFQFVGDGGASDSMGNPFGMFEKDPQDLPGQGLARADNYNASMASSEYGLLLADILAAQPALLSAEKEFGPQYVKQKIKNMQLTLEGDANTPSVPQVYLHGLRLADPEGANLLDTLTSTAKNELALDNQLDPNQTRLVEQSARASAAARGMGFGPSDAFQETLQKLGYGDDLRTKRRNNALTMQQLRQQLAQKGVDIGTGTSTGTTPTLITNEWAGNTLNNVYGQNQQNNRQTSQNETFLAGKYVDMMSSLI